MSKMVFHKEILRVFSQLFTKNQCTSGDAQRTEEQRMNFAGSALFSCCTVNIAQGRTREGKRERGMSPTLTDLCPVLQAATKPLK